VSRPTNTRRSAGLYHRTSEYLLLDWEKEFNKQVNKIRYVIEQTIANFKT